MTDRSDQLNDVSSPAQVGRRVNARDMSIEERFALMWQMTVDEWAKKGIDVANQPMRRDVERVIRNGPDHDDQNAAG